MELAETEPGTLTGRTEEDAGAGAVSASPKVAGLDRDPRLPGSSGSHKCLLHPKFKSTLLSFRIDELDLKGIFPPLIADYAIQEIIWERSAESLKTPLGFNAS